MTAALRRHDCAATDWVVDDLEVAGVEPDRFLYSTLVHHYATHRFDRAWRLFEAMHAQDILPPLRTINALLLSDAITAEQADCVWAAMAAAGVAPNMHSYVGRLRAALVAGKQPDKVRLLSAGERDQCKGSLSLSPALFHLASVVSLR